MRRHFVLTLFTLLTLLTVLSSPSFAWNSTGHETVAQIAYDKLTPDVRAKIVAILKNHHRATEDLLLDAVPGEDPGLAMFLRAATWPDMIKSPVDPMSRPENHPNWHYVDYPYNFDGVQGEVPNETWDGKSNPENLLQAMQKVTAELKDPKTALDRKAIDICWVEHLVGDIHQPLHAVSLFSNEFPRGDRGGNSQMIRTADNIVMNLHSLWDGMEGNSIELTDIRKSADRIEKEQPEEKFKDQIADTKVVDWAKESSTIAQTAVYLSGHLPHGSGEGGNVPNLPPDYMASAHATADARVALGGYRLAALLTEIAGEQQ